VRFEEVLSDLESGGRPRGGAKDDDEGIPSIGAENVLGIGKYDYTKEKYVPEEYFEQMTRGIVRNRDVVLYTRTEPTSAVRPTSAKASPMRSVP
jgi:type I restriction enzyme S subunit